MSRQSRRDEICAKIYILLNKFPFLSISILLLNFDNVPFVTCAYMKLISLYSAHNEIASNDFAKTMKTDLRDIIINLYLCHTKLFSEILSGTFAKGEFRRYNCFHQFYGREFNHLLSKDHIISHYSQSDFYWMLESMGSNVGTVSLPYALGVWNSISASDAILKAKYASIIYSYVARYNVFDILFTGGVFANVFPSIMKSCMLVCDISRSQRSIFNMFYDILKVIKSPIIIKNIITSIANVVMCTGEPFRVVLLDTQLKNIYKEIVKKITDVEFIQQHIQFLKLFRPNLLEQRIISKKEHTRLTKLGVVV
jgi:hypothetical protein